MKIKTLVVLFVFFIYSCNKEQSCIQISNYQNTYVLRDSIVYSHDSSSVVSDTIKIDLIQNAGGKCFINSFGPENALLVTGGCANNFTVDTNSVLMATYWGIGGIANNGQNISLHVYRVSWILSGDTVQYYCSGTRQ